MLLPRLPGDETALNLERWQGPSEALSYIGKICLKLGDVPARFAAAQGPPHPRAGISAGAAARDRLRSKRGAESFVAAWDAVMGAAKRKVTPEERMRRAFDQLVGPVIYGGQCVGLVRKADNSALLSLLAQLDRSRGHEP